jgi:hypothetical protein
MFKELTEIGAAIALSLMILAIFIGSGVLLTTTYVVVMGMLVIYLGSVGWNNLHSPTSLERSEREDGSGDWDLPPWNIDEETNDNDIDTGP